MKLRNYILPAIAMLTIHCTPVWSHTAQKAIDPAMRFNEEGRVSVDGRSVPFLIRRLPVSSFPQLPAVIATELNARGCLIPQTYEAHRPENVIHASLERAGSSDWAVLCSANGRVELLVFFSSNPARPMEIASADEANCLQAHGPSGVLGFNWGIDAATPEQVHEAESGSDVGPATLDHDALSDSVIEQQTQYRYFSKGKWTVVDTE